MMQIISDFIWSIALFGLGIVLWAQGNEDNYGFYCLGLGVVFAFFGYRKWKKRKGEKASLNSEKVKDIAEKAVKGVAAKVSSKDLKGAGSKFLKNKKKLIIGGLIVVVLGAAVYFLFARPKGPIELSGTPEWTFDFPVSSLRDDDVTVVRQEEYFSNGSAKYTVLGNVGSKTQEDVEVVEVIPTVMAQSVDDLEFNLEPEVMSASAPVVLKFTVDELKPQTSEVIKIASRNGVKEAKKRCDSAKITNCQEHFEDIAEGTEEKARMDYQPKTEPVKVVYTGYETNLSSKQKNFYDNILDNSKNLVDSVRYQPVQPPTSSSGEESDEGIIAKIKGWIQDITDVGKTPLEKFIDAGAKVEIKSTALSKSYFPSELTSTWQLDKVEEISSSQAKCRSIKPQKAMLGLYVVPENYKKSLHAYQKDSVEIQISVYGSAKDARQAANTCGDVLFRAPYWVVMDMDFSSSGGGLPKSAIYAVDNYLIYIPTGIGGWNELVVKNTLVPAFRDNVRAQY